MPLIDVPTVHAVTDPQILADPGFKSKAASVFRALGHAGAVHLRGPGMPLIDLYRLAGFLAPLQAETGCRLIVNDRVDVAMAAGAWGVQLRHASLSIQDARVASLATKPALEFGVSIHSVSEALEAVAEHATWVFAGNVFETATHPGLAAKGAEFIRDVARTSAVTIAIGGVRPSDVPLLRENGAHGVAAIRGIWEASDPATAACAYL